MKNTRTAIIATAAVAGGVALGQALPVSAASPAASAPAATAAPAASAPAALAPAAVSAAPTPGTVTIPVGATKQTRILTRDAAQRLANAAQAACARQGHAVTASVVDLDGVVLATTRDETATGVTVAVATGKASAAVGFRFATAEQEKLARNQPGWVQVPGFNILPGGQPIKAGSTLVGGIGVSGAPSGEIDDACATASVRGLR